LATIPAARAFTGQALSRKRLGGATLAFLAITCHGPTAEDRLVLVLIPQLDSLAARAIHCTGSMPEAK
jgi:hypothetical protein